MSNQRSMALPRYVCYKFSDLLFKWSKKDGFYTSFQAPVGFILLLGQTKPHNAATRCHQVNSGCIWVAFSGWQGKMI